jgi:hypothetical protein
MTTGAGRDSERFAAAVDNGHSYTGAVPPGDELLARDLELVALLRESRASLAPTSDASARMRAKVMAAAGTMMASAPGINEQVESSSTLVSEFDDFDEDATEETNVVSIGSAQGRHRFPRRASSTGSAPRRGGIGISAAAALTLLAITGGGALFSKDALPGDTLYGVKQATESGQIALAGNKAQRQLDIAATRIDEVQELNSGRASSSDRSADISQALRGFNEQTTAASRTWLAGPNANNTGTLATWASTQSQRLTSMRSSMPASAQSDADSSIRTLDQVKARANALNSRKGCDTVSGGQSDEFGPIPAKGACSAKDAPVAPKQVVPSLPSPSQRATAPSLENQQRSGSGGSSRVDSDSGPGLQLPELPDTGTGGLLPTRVPTNESTEQPTQQPGLLGGLLGGN